MPDLNIRSSFAGVIDLSISTPSNQSNKPQLVLYHSAQNTSNIKGHPDQPNNIQTSTTCKQATSSRVLCGTITPHLTCNTTPTLAALARFLLVKNITSASNLHQALTTRGSNTTDIRGVNSCCVTPDVPIPTKDSSRYYVPKGAYSGQERLTFLMYFEKISIKQHLVMVVRVRLGIFGGVQFILEQIIRRVGSVPMRSILPQRTIDFSRIWEIRLILEGQGIVYPHGPWYTWLK